LKDDNPWLAIPRQFPKLRALCVEGDLHSSFLNIVKPSFLTDLFPNQCEHLESIDLRNLGVSLDDLLEMVSLMLRKSPVRLRSVACQSWQEEDFAATDAQLEKIQGLREVPDFQVEFRVTNGEGYESDGGFYFAFTRS
jgi:hypothetical protein